MAPNGVNGARHNEGTFLFTVSLLFDRQNTVNHFVASCRIYSDQAVPNSPSPSVKDTPTKSPIRSLMPFLMPAWRKTRSPRSLARLPPRRA